MTEYRLSRPALPLVLIVVVALLMLEPSSAYSRITETETVQPPTRLARGVESGNGPSGIAISEVLFDPTSGAPEWVELKNYSATPLSIRQYGITNQDNAFYRIPGALPDVPAGAFVVLLFDGAGSAGDDYDFGDNVATLHTAPPLVNVLEAADQIALYNATGGLPQSVYLPLALRTYSPITPPVPNPNPILPQNPIVHFVAWGAAPAPDEEVDAVTEGLWPAGSYLDTSQKPGRDALQPGGSIGVASDVPANSPGDWTFYLPANTTRGAANPLPTPFFRNPTDGSSICTSDPNTTGLDLVTFGWSAEQGATGYRLEVDDDPAFGSPLIGVNVTDSFYTHASEFAAGTYYFRVRTLGAGSAVGPFSPANDVTFVDCVELIQQNAQSIAPVLLGVTPKIQHKDTNMLILDGEPATGTARWDAAHESDGDDTSGNGTAVRVSPLDNMYCTRASISMIVAYHGGELSQDRIAFEGYGGGPPESDFGYGIGMWPNELTNQGTGRNIFNWAMNDNVVTSARGKPTYEQVKTWIDGGRPLLVVENNDVHSVVLDGYWDLGLVQFAHRVDPWTGTGNWQVYSLWNISEHHAPPSGVTPRSDEDADGDTISDMVDDSDADGVVDFDESRRFLTNRTVADSDSDLVEEKEDIYEYVFLSNGTYSPLSSDIDGDGVRKELDRDNDRAADASSAAGIGQDGCEDSDRDGKYEPTEGETFNFNPADDVALHIRLTWPLFGSDVDLHLVNPSGQDVYYGNTNPDWGELGVPCDDPFLDRDCITQCTVENTRLPKLENGVYTIRVHYYSDHDLGDTSPQVTTWFQGVQTDYGPVGLADGGWWDVATITWPTGVITPLNSEVMTGGIGSPRPEK